MPDMERLYGLIWLLIVVCLLLWAMRYVLAAVGYVLNAVSLFKLAKRRGIGSPWIAWVPVLQMWTLGSIVDGYQLQTCGKRTFQRWVLAFWNVLAALAEGWIAVQVLKFIIVMMSGGISMKGFSLRWLLVAWTVMAVMAVLKHIALYKLYRSCKPSRSVVYLVLGILVPASQILFVFFCRNKDDGMPLPEPQEQGPEL